MADKEPDCHISAEELQRAQEAIRILSSIPLGPSGGAGGPRNIVSRPRSGAGGPANGSSSSRSGVDSPTMPRSGVAIPNTSRLRGDAGEPSTSRPRDSSDAGGPTSSAGPSNGKSNYIHSLIWQSCLKECNQLDLLLLFPLILFARKMLPSIL